MDEALQHEGFPRASRYPPDWVLSKPFGANVLWLAEWLAEGMNLAPGARVLDLGCGRAKSSIFLAKEYGVQVWAADLWIPAATNLREVRRMGVEDKVFPLHLDARNLPFADEFFDAIVAIDSYQYFGTDDLYLNSLVRFLKPGGLLGMASAGLMKPLPAEVPEHLRRFWTDDNWCIHTLDWWRDHWDHNRSIDVEVASTMDQGWRAWEQWARATNVSEWYLEMLKRDRGEYLGYVRMVARRSAEATIGTPPCPHGCDASKWYDEEDD